MHYETTTMTVIRRPPPAPLNDDCDDEEEKMLDAFYDEQHQEDHPSLSSSSARMHSSSITNALVAEEEYDLDPPPPPPINNILSNASTSSYRRRRIVADPAVGNNDKDSTTLQNAHSNSIHEQQTQQQHKEKHHHLTWNKLNAALFVGQALLSAATSAPITLVPTMALSLASTNDNEEWNYAPYYNLETLEVYDGSGTRKRWIPFRIRTSKKNNNSYNQNISSSSIFASHLTSVVTLVTAFGKFINGILVDVAGARRLLLIYGTCTCLALMGLRYSSTPGWAIGCCAAVEFFSSITWPAGIVILGAHYGMNNGNDSNGRFERGLYVTSLASRCGSLLAIPLTSLVLKWTHFTWRGVAGLASFAAFCGVVVFYVYLTDSPGKLHDPQNPIRQRPQSSQQNNGSSHHPYHPSNIWTPHEPSLFQRAINLCSSVLFTVLPSIRAILSSRVFWAVAAAHAGASMVNSSQRVLGTYFRDTSYGVITESKAGAMTVCLSLGMMGGLLVGGKAFAKAAESEQGNHDRRYNNTGAHQHLQSPLIDAAQVGTKNMIAFFYCLSICMCYMLSFLAMPFVRRALHLPVLVLIIQAICSLGLGFGVAVQYYHIPAIVGATYGRNRGLYTAYTDGVAALVSSTVWRIVGGAVEEGNPQGSGWAYGWAAVALLLLFCGTIMVKIIELYFVGGGWRHQPTEHDQASFLNELDRDLNSSWMDDEIRSTAFSVESSPLRKPAESLNILSSSAFEFIGSPGRGHRGRKMLPIIIDSGDEVDSPPPYSNADTDLLGIDDDGQILPQPLHQDDFVSFNSMLGRKDIDEGSHVRESSIFDDCNDSFEL